MDIVDLASLAEERHRENAIAKIRAKNRLSRNSATSRSEGIPVKCHDCCNIINKKRLAVIPTATRCTECQGRYEKRKQRE
jgi:phage/conjugal plasmid C-4 type zinc finger TraR family protein